jgi:hypothetical protein
MEKNYKGLGLILIIYIPLTFFAFYKTYFGQFPDFDENIDLFIHLHAFIASLWLGMLIVQPLLIRYKRYDLHRQFGKASFFIFPMVIITLIPQIINKYNRDADLLLTLSNTTLLIAFYVLAIVNKKNIAKHMRYMIALSLVFVQPTVARIMIFWFDGSFIPTIHITFFIVSLILLVLLLWDKINNRTYQPYLVALSCFIVYQLLFYIDNL